MYKKLPIHLLLFFPVYFLLSCGNQPAREAQQASQMPDARPSTPLDAVLAAHGGLDTWDQYRQVEFDVFVNDTLVDHQLVDLQTRKVLITADAYTIGFDGKEVWVTPDKEAYKGNSARFYHNLQFYFFAIPFVLADPGTRHEALGQRQFQGKDYDVVKTSYGNNVGDAPEDYYLTYSDPQTHQLKLLLYTVTYFSSTAHENFNARVYDSLQQVDGLTLPAKMISYKWENGTLGEKRSETSFRNVLF